MRIENMALVTETGSGERHHAAQLAAAQYADGGTGWKAHSGDVTRDARGQRQSAGHAMQPDGLQALRRCWPASPRRGAQH